MKPMIIKVALVVLAILTFILVMNELGPKRVMFYRGDVQCEWMVGYGMNAQCYEGRSWLWPGGRVYSVDMTPDEWEHVQRKKDKGEM